MAETRSEVVGVQYLRGICAIAVVFAHCSAMAAFPKYFGHLWLGGALSIGALGVDLFFGISGFIISIVCLSTDTLAPRMSVGDFARKRFVRIVPLMWVAVIAYGALQMMGRGGFNPGGIFLGLVPVFPGETAPNSIWTLRHEMMFYFIFGFSFLGRRQIPWLLGLWFISPIVFAFSGLQHGGPNWWVRWLYEWTHPVDVEFLAGFALGILWLKRTNGFSFRLPVEPFWVLLALFVGFMGIGLGLNLTADKIQSTLVSMVICFGILFVAVHVKCPDGPVRRVGDLLGAASYSIYLFHLHFVSALLGIWAHFAKSTPIFIAVPGVVLLAVVATCCVHVFVERPLIKFTNKVFRGDIPPVSTNIRKIALIAAAVIFVLVFGSEIGLRMLGFGHPLIYKASVAGYEFAAGQTSTRLGKISHINALGVRGLDTTPLPSQGIVRILSLGDSVSNGGTQINDSQTYPADLQRILGPHSEVLNASVGGWATENERAWLQEHGTLGASTIILEVNEKDLDQPFAPSSTLDANPSFPSHYPATAIGELLGRYIAPKLGLSKPAADPGSTPTGINPAAEVDVLTTVADIAKISATNHAKFVIMYWDAHYGAPPLQTVATREKLFAWANASDIIVVRPNLSALPNWKAYFRDPMHPNAAANRIIADQLARALSKSS